MNIQTPVILTIASLAILLPNQVGADDLKEAKVTQVIQDVKVLPSNASPRPAALNDHVRQGTAVQTGVQSRSELTFKDETITRLGEKTIFSVGEGARTIDLGSGQFLLYVPKKSGGAKIKMGPVTAAITGTTILGDYNPSGVTRFIVLEGGACIYLDSMGQSIFVGPGQTVTYDPITRRLEDPVDVDVNEVPLRRSSKTSGSCRARLNFGQQRKISNFGQQRKISVWQLAVRRESPGIKTTTDDKQPLDYKQS